MSNNYTQTPEEKEMTKKVMLLIPEVMSSGIDGRKAVQIFNALMCIASVLSQDPEKCAKTQQEARAIVEKHKDSDLKKNIREDLGPKSFAEIKR